jgi:hypothetical protein
MAGAWVLRATHVLASWPYAIVTLAILAVAPTVGAVIHHRRVPEGERIRVTHAEAVPDQILEAGGTMAIDPADVVVGAEGRLSGPLEWLGITQPYRDHDVAVMDRVLALPAITPKGTNGAA